VNTFIITTPPEARALTANEQALLLAYRRMDARSRDFISRVAKSQADRNPMSSTNAVVLQFKGGASDLHLISGDAS
jgi:hypothetical protein